MVGATGLYSRQNYSNQVWSANEIMIKTRGRLNNGKQLPQDHKQSLLLPIYKTTVSRHITC